MNPISWMQQSFSGILEMVYLNAIRYIRGKQSAKHSRLRRKKQIPISLRFYQEVALGLLGVESREHTAQISYDHRLERETKFRKGELACLFCSPTMELGIDISDLKLVHLRNVPPTPANYAQTKRAGGKDRGSGTRPYVLRCRKWT